MLPPCWNSCLLKAPGRSAVRLCHVTSWHSSDHGHPACLSLSTPVSMGLQMSVQIPALNSFGRVPRSGICWTVWLVIRCRLKVSRRKACAFVVCFSRFLRAPWRFSPLLGHKRLFSVAQRAASGTSLFCQESPVAGHFCCFQPHACTCARTHTCLHIHAHETQNTVIDSFRLSDFSHIQELFY